MQIDQGYLFGFNFIVNSLLSFLQSWMSFEEFFMGVAGFNLQVDLPQVLFYAELNERPTT
jgi:hypothetical protein